MAIGKCDPTVTPRARRLVTICAQMDLLTGAFHVVAVVIVVGGAAKVASPDAFAALLRSLRLPGGTALARLAGAVEVALGCTAVVVGGVVATGAVALAYAVFAAVVVVARRRGAASCGCFGAAAAPPSPVHVAVNSISALIAGAAAVVGGIPDLVTVLGDQPLAGVPYMVLVAVGTWLAVTIDTTGAVVLERMSAVAELRPTFQANSGHSHQPARTGGRRR